MFQRRRISDGRYGKIRAALVVDLEMRNDSRTCEGKGTQSGAMYIHDVNLRLPPVHYIGTYPMKGRSFSYL